MDGGHRSRASASTPFTLWINMVRYNILFQLQMGNIPIFPQEIYFSPISIFLNLLILKCQGMDKSPFDTHPKTMTAAIFSFLLFCYCLRFHDSSNRGLSNLVLLFWSFGLVSLVSLLFPDSIRPILYMLCFVLPILELICSFGMRIWRVFGEWLNLQMIRIAGHFFINPIVRNRRLQIPRLPV